MVVDPLFTDHVYVGNDIGLYFTANGGATWVELGEGLPEAVIVSDLTISASDRKLRLMTHGNGAYERDLVGPLVAVGPPTVANRRLALAPAAPNPFSARTQIRFTLPADSQVKLEVYDVRGALVRELASGAFDAGTHTIPWNARSDRDTRIAPGAYFVRLQAAGETVTRQVVRVE